MTTLTRRHLLKHGTLSVAASALGAASISKRLLGDDSAKKARFTMDLRCGSIGVRADQREAIRLAHEFGFQSVAADAGFLANLSESDLAKLQDEMRLRKLVWGAAGLPVNYAGDEEEFASGMKQLPRLAAGLERAGVTRVGTWIPPSHDELTYLANFHQKARRLRACGEVLADHGLRLGLEYIGPKTLWAARLHPFVHTMEETKELLAEIGLGNVGFVLDSWHWYTAYESVDDLLTLKNEEIVACDLNDAPAGIPVDEQIDNRRELPTATGVIDLKAFLSALIQIGYDGPIRAEPFNQPLNALDNEPAVAATAEAMKKAFALVGAASR